MSNPEITTIVADPITWESNFRRYIQRMRLAGLTPNLDITNLAIELHGQVIQLQKGTLEDEINFNIQLQRRRDEGFRRLHKVVPLSRDVEDTLRDLDADEPRFPF